MPFWWPDAALILAASPVVAFLMAYAREYGYLSVLGLPTSLVSLQFPLVAEAVVGLLGVLAIIWNTSNLIYIVLRGQPLGPIADRVLPAATPAAVFAIANLWIYRAHVWEWMIPSLVLAGAFAVLVSVYVVLPLFAHRHLPTSAERWARQDQIDSTTGGFIFDISRSRFRHIPLLLIALLGLCYLSYATGRASALDQDVYMVDSVDPSWVVVRLYSDDVLMAKIDARHLATGEFRIAKLDPGRPLDLSSRRIGPIVRDCQVLIGCHSPQ